MEELSEHYMSIKMLEIVFEDARVYAEAWINSQKVEKNIKNQESKRNPSNNA